jgi:hypothetical protein
MHISRSNALNIDRIYRVFRKDVIAGVVYLIRNAHEYDSLQVDDNNIYVFKKSEVNNEEVPNDAVVIKEDKPGILLFKILVKKKRLSVTDNLVN